MTNVTQNPEPFITHHSVDDQPLISFDEAIAIFQEHFPVTGPLFHREKLVYENFSGLAFANAYRKVAHSIITQYSLPLEAIARQHSKTRRIDSHISSMDVLFTYLIIIYKP